MKLSWNWLKDYVKLPSLSTEEILKKISLSICEVEQYQEIAYDLDKILVAEVLAIRQHPNADRLSLVKITTGSKEYEIVCGAKNFAVGDKVPYAPLGTKLEEFIVKKAKIRGVDSHGVLCSQEEIGFSEECSGLMLLDKKNKVGVSLLDIYPEQKDLILHIDNKSINHRPDLWGHYGFARELSVLFDTTFYELPLVDKIKFQTISELNLDFNELLNNIPVDSYQSDLRISIDCPNLVPRFTSLSIDNVENTTSPDWIKFRLYKVGLRAINNLVDVTNYVMLDLGQPMHIFDKDKLQGKKLIIRKASQNEQLQILSDKKVTLDSQDIVISDAKNIVSIAGITGGKDSGVQEQTKNVLLEAACWHASSVRKTATKIKNRTDASQRFEKSLDAHLTNFAIAKAATLLKVTCPNLKRQGSFVDLRNDNQNNIFIDFDYKKCTHILGVSIPEVAIAKILIKLGFAITKKKQFWKIQVPSWRATRDIALEVDLIEEVGRFFGYDKIIAKSPLFSIIKPKFNTQRKLERKAKQILVDRGYFEIFTYPLTNEDKEKNWEVANAQISKPLLNPSSDEETKMRLSLLPSIAEAVSLNVKNYISFQLFEIGKIYFWLDKVPQEKNIVMLASYSEEKSLKYLFQETKTTASIWFQKLLQKPLDIALSQNVPSYQHPFVSGDLIAFGQKLGKIFSLTPQKRKQLTWKGNIVFVEFFFDDIFSLYQKKKKTIIFKELAKFPAAKFEISLVVSKNTYFSELKAVVIKEKILEDIRFQYDYALPEQAEKKSVTLSMSFRLADQTISAENLIKIQDKIVQMFENKGYMLRR